jgi:hypothetical protein
MITQPNVTRSLTLTREVVTSLPLQVNVQDFFRGKMCASAPLDPAFCLIKNEQVVLTLHNIYDVAALHSCRLCRARCGLRRDGSGCFWWRRSHCDRNATKWRHRTSMFKNSWKSSLKLSRRSLPRHIRPTSSSESHLNTDRSETPCDSGSSIARFKKVRQRLLLGRLDAELLSEMINLIRQACARLVGETAEASHKIEQSASELITRLEARSDWSERYRMTGDLDLFAVSDTNDTAKEVGSVFVLRSES